MEGKELVSITQNELDQLDQEYVDYSKKAHKDLTYESDYQAAFRVPAAFLKKPSNLEQSFDRILFHLDEAYRKSIDENTKLTVSRTTDDIFHKVICIIKARIDNKAKENKKGLFQKFGESVTNFIDNLRKNLDLENPSAILLASATPEVGKLSVAFFDYLLIKWELKGEESYFYNQLANVYQKILDSKSFSNQFGLIRNTFTTNKENILSYVVQEKGLTAAQNLMKYDEKDSERQDSARIILRTLTDTEEWEKGADLLHEINVAQLANYNELKEEFIDKYKQFLKYFKSGEAKGDPRKEIKVRYPTSDAIEYLINADNTGYETYIHNYKLKQQENQRNKLNQRRKNKRKKVIRVIARLIILLLIIGAIIVFYQRAKLNYLPEAQKESSRISMIASEVDSLVQKKDFGSAIKKANEIAWNNKSLFPSGDYEKKTEDFRQYKKTTILDNILLSLKDRNSQLMDNENYRYINQELIPVYNNTIKGFDDKLKESYKEKIKPLLNELNQVRDNYLVKLQAEIIKKINKKDYSSAMDMANNLYHLSKETYKGGNIITGLFKDSYKEHWDKEKDQLMTRIKEK